MSRTIGPREMQLRALRDAATSTGRTARKSRVKLDELAADIAEKINPTPQLAAEPTEKTMTKKPTKIAKAKKTNKAKKHAPPKSDVRRADNLIEGSKQAIMLDYALKPEGVFEKALLKKLGWVKCRVTLKRVCEKVGATLVIEKTPSGALFKATLPPAPPVLKEA